MSNQAYTRGFSKVGQDVVIWPLAKIINAGCIEIGNAVIIDDFVLLMSGPKTAMGSFIHIASFTSITGGGELVMEDFTTISSGTRVFTGNEDYLGGCLTNSAVPFPYRIPVRSYVHIKKHAIIAANCVILPGVTIGEGAVVGANSFVRRDCKPWTVNFGSPTRERGPRRQDKILELEAQLRRELYDGAGRYIPKAERKPSI